MPCNRLIKTIYPYTKNNFRKILDRSELMLWQRKFLKFEAAFKPDNVCNVRNLLLMMLLLNDTTTIMTIKELLTYLYL